MKLFLVLILVPQIRSYNNVYNGFNYCGQGGWSCQKHPGTGRQEVTFDCYNSGNPDTRIWTWTARIPSSAQVLTIQNCNEAEIHMDCTRGHRGSDIQLLRLLNIKNLIMLNPAVPHVELHDNAQIPHMPDAVIMENIGKTSFYPGLFDNAPSLCTYSNKKLMELTIKHSNIGSLKKGIFNNTLSTFKLSNVKVDEMETGSITLEGNVTIENSTFQNLPVGGVFLKGKKIIFRNNHVEKIYSNGITAYGYDFEFIGNRISEIMSHGLNVSSSLVSINNNSIYKMDTGALENVSPSYYPIPFQEATKLTYSFAQNRIDLLLPNSIHNNWKAYNKTCSDIIIDNNVLDCSCDNLHWLQVIDSYKKDLNNAGFYRKFINAMNQCSVAENCTVTKVIKDICSNSSITNLCMESEEKRKEEWCEESNSCTTEKDKTSNTTSEIKQWESISETTPIQLRQELPDESYYRDTVHSVEDTSNSVLVGWIIVLLVLLVLILSSLVLYIWYIKRTKKINYQVNDIYKYDKNKDSDGLVHQGKLEASVECENLLFQN